MRSVKRAVFKERLVKFHYNFRESKNLFNHRINLLSELINKEYSKPLFNNPAYIMPNNIMGLRRMVLEYFSEEGMSGEFFKIEEPVDNIINWLAFEPKSNFKIDLINKYNLMDLDYDFDHESYNIYFNMGSHHGGLFVKKLATVNIIYREICPGEVENFLKNFLKEYGYRLIFDEPVIIGYQTALSLKRFILCEYTGLGDIINDDIVTDAYTDLIRVSSLDMVKGKNERVGILQKHQQKFRDNLTQSIQKGFYVPCPLEDEVNKYEELIAQLVTNINKIKEDIVKKRELSFEISTFYNVQSKLSESNRTKQEYGWIKREVIRKLSYNREISSIINDVHPDIIISIFITLLHIELLGLSSLYYKGSSLSKYFRIITDEILRRKPVLLKYIIKNSIDKELHDLKELGFISMHQLENFYGYRITGVIKEEVKKDYMEWFNQGREKYGSIQSAFIHKWAKSFFESFNYKGRRICDIMNANIRNYKNEDDMLGNILSYMKSKGAVDDEKVKIKGKNRFRSISKNNYFNLICDQKDYKIRGNRRNKVIIKREEYIKQRIVINSSLDTFVPLSKINKILAILTGGTGIIYYSNNKKQKAEHYSRLISYLNYNKYMENKWLCMPLDYSSYDHTITIDMIKAIIWEVSDYYRLPKLKEWFNQFYKLLIKEPIYFKELEGDVDNNQKYKYGVLSGWKITSSIESLGNAIVTYGVMNELHLKLQDYETMGDDLIIVLDYGGVDRDEQIAVLTKVCDFYESLGFKMNVPKNSIGYYFLEFLRVTFKPGVIQGYPSRIITSAFYLKPGKGRLNFGAAELESVLYKICKRYGVLSQRYRLAEYISKAFEKQDIRENFSKYLQNPDLYEVKRIEKLDFEYDIKVESTPIYKRYILIFGEEFSKLINHIIHHEVISQVRYVTKLVKKKTVVDKLKEWQFQLLFFLIMRYGRKQIYGNDKFLFFPEYHHTTIMLRILRNSHFKSFTDMKTYCINVFKRMYLLGYMRYLDMGTNIRLIEGCADLGSIRDLIDDKKVGVGEYNMPSIIMSRYKEVIKTALVEILPFMTDIEVDFIRSILHGTKNMTLRKFMGKLLNVRCEMMGMYSGLPIAMMAD